MAPAGGPAAAFSLYSGLVYVFVGLYKASGGSSLPDLYNIVRAATVLAVTLLVLDYVLLAPNLYGTFFFGKIDHPLLAAADRVPAARIACRFATPARCITPRSANPRRSSRSAAPPTPTCCCARSSGAVTKIRPVGILSPSPADRGQAIRGVPVLGDVDDIERIVADLGNRGTRVTRLVFTPSAFGPDQAGNDSDAGAAARAGNQPAAVARRWRRGAAAGAGPRRGSAAASG